MFNKRFLVVGQGLAGSILAYKLLSQQQRVTIIEGHLHGNNASKVASGIINPVTGRRIVKTWLCDDLIPHAWQFYSTLQKILETKIIAKKKVLRYFENIQEYNDFTIKTSETPYKNYLESGEGIPENQFISNEFGCGIIKNALQLNTTAMLSKLQNWFSQKQCYIAQRFNYEDLVLSNDKVKWKDETFDYVIFCEGFKVNQNPYFKQLPFWPTKGEVLICKIPDFKTNYLIKKGVFIVPMADGLFWVGATTHARDTSLSPSQKGIDWLKNKLNLALKIKYEIVDIKVGIRPTTKDRRPIIGLHPQHKRLGIFNGMGTKGASLAPYFAQHFIEHLLYNKPLIREVDLERFL